MAQQDNPVPAPAELNAEQAQAVGGGNECNINDYITALEDLKQAYESLIEFTSYVIERVAGD